VSGVTIFISKIGIEQAKQQELQDFLKTYTLAQDIHSLHLSLQNSAHPDYQVSDVLGLSIIITIFIVQ
jgi:hypothetical protein